MDRYYIPNYVVEDRRRRLVKYMESMGIDLLYIASSKNVYYLSNFYFIPTERPIALLIDNSGESTLYVPLLEYEHALKYGYVDNVVYYDEYPGETHPMRRLAEYLLDKFRPSSLGYDVDGYGWVFGYRGPSLSSLLKVSRLQNILDFIEEMRMVKDPHEIRVLRESSRWTSKVHRYLQDYIEPGLTEDYVSMKASLEVSMEMFKSLKGRYYPVGWLTGAHAGFRGQIGEHSYYPHSLTQHATFERGQVLVTGAGASVSGYSVELERTMYIGEPSNNVVEFFNHMLRAQETAFETIRAGVKCSEVDKAVRKYFRDNGLMRYWRHHTGHGIGLDYHEAPFLDTGDERVLREGMVLTVEPGIYVKGLGGFRHSDTVLVTSDGCELLTDYPRDLDSLIIK